MAVLNYQAAAVTGLTPTMGAAGTDTVQPNPVGFLVVRNSHATNTSTVTIVVPGSAYGQARPDVVHTVPALTERYLIGGLVPDLQDPTTGMISVNTTGTGTPTIAAVSL